MHPLSLLRRQLPRRGSREYLAFPSGGSPAKRARGCIFGGEATGSSAASRLNVPPQSPSAPAPPAGEPSFLLPPPGEVPRSGQGGAFLEEPSQWSKKTAGEGVSLPLFLFRLFHYVFPILIRSCNGCLRRCSSHRPGLSYPRSCCSPDRCRCLCSGRCFLPAAGLSSLRRSLRGWTSVLLR